MKLFLASTYPRPFLIEEVKKLDYVLESFHYIAKWQIPLIKDWEIFLLDSGAFTFMSSKKNNDINWNEYLDKYINFINENDIKYFFELDIDSIVGYENVLKMRKKLESKTKKKCIPVWHKSRGLEEYINLCKTYDYIAIGGFAMRDIKKKDYIYIKELLKISSKYNCKVHGLGFTPLKGLEEFKFYSVDSSSWTSGSRYAVLFKFVNNGLTQIKKPNNSRMTNHKVFDKHNLQEWYKWQQYLKSRR